MLSYIVYKIIEFNFVARDAQLVKLCLLPLLQCLVKFSSDLICSGGSDLCLWDRKGQVLSKFSRKNLEEKSRSMGPSH